MDLARHHLVKDHSLILDRVLLADSLIRILTFNKIEAELLVQLLHSDQDNQTRIFNSKTLMAVSNTYFFFILTDFSLGHFAIIGHFAMHEYFFFKFCEK